MYCINLQVICLFVCFFGCCLFVCLFVFVVVVDVVVFSSLCFEIRDLDINQTVRMSVGKILTCII